jgi:hypothetical protein
MTAFKFKLLSSKTEDITPELAVRFNTMPETLAERKLKKQRLDYLSNAIQGGDVIAFNWATAKVEDTGEEYRVNGHHSSHLLAQMNGQMPEGLKAHIDTYSVPNKEALALLFRQFDNRVSVRSINEISGVYQGLNINLKDIPIQVGRHAIDGMVWYMKKIAGEDTKTGDDRFDYFYDREKQPFVIMVGRVYSKSKTGEFTTPVIGAMYGTWQREPTVAEIFWTAAARPGTAGDTHPAQVLDAWLVKKQQGEGEEKRPTEFEFYNACATAWNAHRHDRPLTPGYNFKYSKKKGPPELE